MSSSSSESSSKSMTGCPLRCCWCPRLCVVAVVQGVVVVMFCGTDDGSSSSELSSKVSGWVESKWTKKLPCLPNPKDTNDRFPDLSSRPM
eukprot:scaffold16950_cov54-Attheya_sp.AAC.1